MVEPTEDLAALTLLGRGREADVYALDDARVLRRYHSREIDPAEVRLMTHVREAGYPAPLVHEASGRDIVMERLNGPSLLDLLLDGTEGCGAMLAEVHNRLHALTAPEWLPRHHSGGDRIAHVDLHPANVIVTDAGPMVIDWPNAVAAEPGFDVAITIVVLTVSSPPDLDPAVLDAIRRPLIDEFTANVDHDPEPWLAAAVRHWTHNPTLGQAERDHLWRWLSELES